MKILTIIGTRPEAIKMAPVVLEGRRRGHEVIVCSSGQHRDMLRHGLEPFGLGPDIELDTTVAGQRLDELTGRLLTTLTECMLHLKPDACLVHGDTRTCLAGGLAAFWLRLPCGHVEAGLRSGCLTNPFPEEHNRRLVDQSVQWHFAPTTDARRNLIAEGIRSESILVTGNTAVDAILHAKAIVESKSPEYVEFDPAALNGFKVILVTGHRRENHGDNLDSLCRALRRTIELEPKACVVFPVHLNPVVRRQVFEHLTAVGRTFLIPPQPYLAFVDLMRRSDVIISDSGGIQEEAPSLNKLVLVTRENTERPEVLETGLVELVGNDEDQLVARLQNGLAEIRSPHPPRNPVGDGHASRRIFDFLETKSASSRRAVA